MTSLSLDGTVALVTGATSGIGAATAAALAEHGAHVLAAGRNAQRGEDVVTAIRARGGKADFFAADLRDAASARQLARRATEAGGRVDILVNNAGIYPATPTAQVTEEEFDTVFAVNTKAPYFLVAELAPAMAARGKGSIVNVSSMTAEFGMPGLSVYGSSKAAMNLLTKAWAAEFGPQGVRVNAVSVGPTRTEGTEPMTQAIEILATQAPVGRPAMPEEIAAAIVYLASDAASFVQGAVLAVDGGHTAV